MEFWSTVLGLLRSRAVMIPTVLVALGLAALAYLGTPDSYTSSTTMVLTTTEYGGTESQDPEDPTELTNPMLNFNDSLRTTAGILISSMNTKEVDTQLGALGPTQLFVNDGRTNPDLLGLNGPFVYIVVKSTSRSEASRVTAAAQKLMREKLETWQSSLGAPEKTFVSLADVVPAGAPQVDRGQAVKLAMVSFVFGLLLCLGIAYFGRQFRARRRLRSGRATATAAAPPVVAEPDVPVPGRRRLAATADPTRRPELVELDERQVPRDRDALAERDGLAVPDDLAGHDELVADDRLGELRELDEDGRQTAGAMVVRPAWARRERPMGPLTTLTEKPLSVRQQRRRQDPLPKVPQKVNGRVRNR